jgi:hypothetical protein
VDLHTYAPKIFREVTERPVASRLAAWQSRQANFVTSLFHSAMLVEDGLVKELLNLLDGTRNRDELLTALEGSIDSRRNTTGAPGKPIREDAQAYKLLQEGLDQNLAKLARMGLLAA